MIDQRRRDFLASFQVDVVIELDGLGATLFCHGSPRSDEEILTRITPERRWRPMFAGVGQRVVVCGHTHAQFDRMLGGVRVVNAGSVGMPYTTASRGPSGRYWVPTSDFDAPATTSAPPKQSFAAAAGPALRTSCASRC
jgi:predicted phosphodiesterase